MLFEHLPDGVLERQEPTALQLFHSLAAQSTWFAAVEAHMGLRECRALGGLPGFGVYGFFWGGFGGFWVFRRRKASFKGFWGLEGFGAYVFFGFGGVYRVQVLEYIENCDSTNT